jgi:hypothetical protein
MALIAPLVVQVIIVTAILDMLVQQESTPIQIMLRLVFLAHQEHIPVRVRHPVRLVLQVHIQQQVPLAAPLVLQVIIA